MSDFNDEQIQHSLSYLLDLSAVDIKKEIESFTLAKFYKNFDYIKGVCDQVGRKDKNYFLYSIAPDSAYEIIKHIYVSQDENIAVVIFSSPEEYGLENFIEVNKKRIKLEKIW